MVPFAGPSVCLVAGMVVLATVLTGCGEQEMKMDLTCTCSKEGDKGCESWSQTGITGSKDEPDAFKVNIGFACREWSAKGFCKAWSQSGSALKEGGSGCFPGSTLVLTRGGPMAMSELSIGDELLGMDPSTGEITFSAVRAWLHREVETEMAMTVVRTEAGRVIVSPRHSIATGTASSSLRYIFAEDLNIGDVLWASNGSRLTVLEKGGMIARGLYSPSTATSNYFAGESADSMVLSHNFAHLPQPELFAGAVHLIFDVAEFVWPGLHNVDKDNKHYVHPIMKLLAPLIGVHLE